MTTIESLTSTLAPRAVEQMILADDVLGDVLKDAWPNEHPSRLVGRASIDHRRRTAMDSRKETVISQGGVMGIVGRGNVRWHRVRSTE